MTTHKDLSGSLEFHYFLNDNSHTMDAEIRNKCEHELLSIIKEISSILEVDLTIETEALLEGGLRERLNILAKNKFLQGVFSVVIATVITHYIITDRELKKLEKEEKLLNIEKLKQELNQEQEDIPNINIENVVFVFNHNYKIIKHRSNYYKYLNNYPKISQFSTALLDEQNQISSETIIEKRDFEKFILDTDELPDIKDEEATIEIISPVLKKGGYKWKGIYMKTGEVIDFSMKDSNYKEEVIREGISFKNGTCIDCSLTISRKLDEFGVEKNTGYSVNEVINTHDEIAFNETNLGRKKRNKKLADKQQRNLFDEEEQ